MLVGRASLAYRMDQGRRVYVGNRSRLNAIAPRERRLQSEAESEGEDRSTPEIPKEEEIPDAESTDDLLASSPL